MVGVGVAEGFVLGGDALLYVFVGGVALDLAGLNGLELFDVYEV